MAGIFTVKNLAEGQLPTSKTALYITPSGTQTIIKTIILVNTDTSSKTVNLYFKANGGISRRIIPKDMELEPSYSLIFDDELTLGEGDAIEGDASVENIVDYTINGVEEV